MLRSVPPAHFQGKISVKKTLSCFVLCAFAGLFAGCADAPVDNTQLADASTKPSCQQADSATGSIMVRHTCRASMTDDERTDLNNQLHGSNPVSQQPSAMGKH